jgi:hypothetical protein
MSEVADSPPSDADIAKARADQARAANLAKARDAKAAKAAAKAPEQPAGEGKAPKERKSLEDGAKLAVRVFWTVSKIGARFAGGRLEDLSDEELEEGTAELLPVVRRFPLIASILAWVGFPFWLVRLIGSKFREVPADKKPGEQQLPAANVHQLQQRGQA